MSASEAEAEADWRTDQPMLNFRLAVSRLHYNETGRNWPKVLK